MAGSVAGVFSTTLMAPGERIKCLLQVNMLNFFHLLTDISVAAVSWFLGQPISLIFMMSVPALSALSVLSNNSCHY